MTTTPARDVCTAGEPSPLSLERLSAFADGDLSGGELASVRQHLEACAACARQADELGALARAVRGLGVPEPPATLWPAIAGVLAREDDGALARASRWGRWLSWRPFAVGALAGAAAVAAISLGARHEGVVARATPPAAVEPERAAPVAAPPRDPLLAEAEQEFASAAAVYERSIEKLRRLLVREETSWSPDVRARYDERLARLDEAITRSREEARRAPADSAGNEQLFAAYQQKIAFLAETVHRGGGAARGDAVRRSSLVAGVVLGVVAFLALGAHARAEGQGPDAGTLTDRREIAVPVPPGGVEIMRIDNPMGRIEIRGGGRPDVIHIVAEKRASSPEALGRLRVHYTAFQSGEVQVDTRVELEGRERSVPLGGSGIDFVIEVPADVAIEAKTFGGDVRASGLRAGARLETTGGRIGVSDVRGPVVTRQLRGGQSVSGVEGDVDLDGIEGDLDLRGVAGGRASAHVVDGNIRAEDVRAAWVRLQTTTGEIVLLGPLRPGGRYDLRSYAGDVRVLGVGAAPVALRARSSSPVQTSFPLRGARRQGEWLYARIGAGASVPGTRAALLDVSSVLARVMIQPSGSEADGAAATGLATGAAEPR